MDRPTIDELREIRVHRDEEEVIANDPTLHISDGEQILMDEITDIQAECDKLKAQLAVTIDQLTHSELECPEQRCERYEVNEHGICRHATQCWIEYLEQKAEHANRK